MATPLPTYTVILTKTDGTPTGIIGEQTFTGVTEAQIAKYSAKKIWQENVGLYWVQMFQEN
jgi:hypothetical protein